MKRLTERTAAGVANINYSGCYFDDGMRDIIAESARRQTAIERLAFIEDILGEDYDLDRLRELVEADRDGRCVVLPCNAGTVFPHEGTNYEADHWNIILTAFADDPSTKSGHRIKLFSLEEASEAALKGEAYGG